MRWLDDLRMPHALKDVDTITTDNTARAEWLSRIDWGEEYVVTTDGKIMPKKYLVKAERVIISLPLGRAKSKTERLEGIK